jgi:hypothetical protein
MLKKKTRNVLPALALVLLLSRAPSQAAPAVPSLFPTDSHASLLDKLAHWLDFMAGGAKAKKPRAPSHHATSLASKHGCGIDPQGQPYCIP